MRKIIVLITILTCSFFIPVKAQSKEQVNKVKIDVSKTKFRISKFIYGNFSEHLGHCIYGGFWVGENSTIPNTRGIRNDVVEALRKIKLPVLRWPGGCFADEYHWKDGVGNRNERPSMINTNWGGITEDNSFGTHEFLDLCQQIGCEPYFSGNVGSGTVQEMSQWVEYLNSDNISPMTNWRKKNGREKSWDVKFWGLGNEAWGCGGQMKVEYYVNLARQYSSFCKDYGKNTLRKIASGANGDDYHWTEVMMRDASNILWGVSLHYYTWCNGEYATQVDEEKWFNTMKKTLYMEELVNKHSAIMDKYDPEKTVSLVVDEWGDWFSVEPETNPGFLYQQNTIRDALVAGTNLNIFNNHCDRVRMANIAQAINVLQAVILTKDDKMILTPTYHVFDLYKVHQDALMVPTTVESNNYSYKDNRIPAINCSASLDKEEKIHISVCNLNPMAVSKVLFDITGYKAQNITAQILTADKMDAHNTFENSNNVTIKNFKGFKLDGNQLKTDLPPMSVTVFEITGTFEETKVPEVKNLSPGLKYDYFEGNWSSIPDFNQVKPLNSGIISNFMFPKDVRNENFGLSYIGYIKIQTNGIYDFFVTSDDGSKLYVDNKEIVTNDGLHAPIEKQGSVLMGEGMHEIKVLFIQGGGGKSLDVNIEGPGLNRQSIPENILFHSNSK
jgi:alpha-N-arabinofuranosidase